MLDTGLYAEGKEASPGTQNVDACCLVTWRRTERGTANRSCIWADLLCHIRSMHFNGNNISEDAPKRFGADLTVHVTQQSHDEVRGR